MAATVNSSMIGVSLTTYTTTAQFALGSTVLATDGSMYQYVQASENISQYGAVAIYGKTNTVRLLETSIANAAGVLNARAVGFAQTSIASAAYGWVARMGKVIVQVADDCAAGVRLFTTSTAGTLDDATVSECLVSGIQLVTTSSLPTAMTGYAATPAFVGMYTNPA